MVYEKKCQYIDWFLVLKVVQAQGPWPTNWCRDRVRAQGPRQLLGSGLGLRSWKTKKPRNLKNVFRHVFVNHWFTDESMLWVSCFGDFSICCVLHNDHWSQPTLVYACFYVFLEFLYFPWNGVWNVFQIDQERFHEVDIGRGKGCPKIDFEPIRFHSGVPDT